MPTAVVPSGISLITTEPAPMMQSLPMLLPCRVQQPMPVSTVRTDSVIACQIGAGADVYKIIKYAVMVN